MSLPVRATLLMIGGTLLACASTPSASPQYELVVEGNPSSYPAFEVAAKNCGYTTMVRKSDGRGGTLFNVFVHYPLAGADRWILKWLDDHPDTGLLVAAH